MTAFVNLKSPRFFEFDSKSRMYVPERETGRLWRIPTQGATAGRRELLIEKLDDPTSVAVDEKRNKLYIGEQSALSSFDLKTHAYEKLLTLPRGGRHLTRTVVLDYPYIYISVGSSCDSCVEKDPLRATILQYNVRTQKARIYSKGIRNAVGLAVYNHDLYATVNERDYLGDDFPPDLLVYVPPFSDFGWPYCNVNKPDPKLGFPGACKSVPSPLWKFTAHSAPLGLDFSPDGKFILVAQHGSWNRSKPSGHAVVSLRFKDGKIENETPLAQLDRPVGVKIHDKMMYVSDDSTGAITRLPLKEFSH